MSDFWIALKSLTFHRQVNLAIVLGVAAATAVLTGALIVGDSMRGSLRDLTLERLGKIDLMIVSEGFFREDLATDLEQTDLFRSELELVTPVIFFPNGTVERNQSDSTKNLGQVTLLGIQPKFWQFGDSFTKNLPDLAADEVIINQVVADDLGLDEDSLEGARLTVGVPKRALLASDSSLGNKKDLVERIVDLKVVGIVPAKGLGRFGLHPTQIAPRLVYLPINAMQDALNDGVLKYKTTRQQANMLLLATRLSDAGDAEIAERVSRALEPTLGDLGLNLKHVVRSFDDVDVFDYFSLSSDRLVLPTSTANSIRAAFPKASEVFTYLANEMVAVRDVKSGDAKSSGVPFSMVSAVDFTSTSLPSIAGETVSPLTGNQIAVNSWTAKDQDLEVGDTLRLSFFEPETTHGEETERFRDFTVADIVDVTEPTEPPRVSRRQGFKPAVFSTAPTRANDPDFTPTVPGLTDADSIERWDLPFETADQIRPQDDDYWTYYRTTPKAFVSLDTARELWASRFGDTTSFQIPASGWDLAKITQKLISQFRQQNEWPGLQIIPIKSNGLKASAGATPFDALFLSLSMFVIAAALALVSLLFRLAFQKRSSEMGTLLAVGFRQKQVARIWMLEMLGVCLTGSLLGVFLGIGYASVMIYGLKTWWVGAITTPFLNMHIGSFTLPLGMGLGLLICGITIGWSIRSARKQSVRGLLSGQLNSTSVQRNARLAKFANGIIVGCTLLAVILTYLAATQLAGESQAGAFMGSGFLILLAALIWIHQYISRLGRGKTQAITLSGLATTHAGRNPMRSTLTIGLVAVASFLILAISAFRLSPTEQGTAGFNYLATTSQPVFANLDTPAGQSDVLIGPDATLADTSRVLSFRYKEGEDASCNNPYQSSQPQVLGVTEATMDYFDDASQARFSFSMTGGDNPWRLLNTTSEDGVIPVIIDKNTAWYSLKVYTPGTEFTVDFDSGESLTFRLVGLLNNSVLQGMLLISETNFTKAFPELSGYRTFLMKLKDTSEVDQLTTALSDQGFDAQGTERLLTGYLAVQNTYLSTFQSLGLLGLLLGTLGLAAVQLRSILERRQELGLMRAIGFTKAQLAQMIMTENAWLLMVGMGIGMVAALVTTFPHYVFGDASMPWRELLAMFAAITFVGLLTTWLASRSVFRAPLIDSLRTS